jgi:hypothetical protein
MDPRVTEARNEAWRERADIDYGIAQYIEDRDDFLRKDIPDFMGRLERVTAMDPSELTQEVADDMLSKVHLPGQHGMRNRDYLKREIGMNSMKPQLGQGDPDPAGVVHKRVLITVFQEAITYMKQLVQDYDEEIRLLREEREKLLAPFNLLPTNKGTNKRSGGRNEGGLQGMGVPDHMRRGEMWQAGLNRRS